MPQKFLRNVQIGVGFSLVILLASSVASYMSIQEQTRNRQELSDTRRSIATVKDVLSTLQDAETGNRGFQLTGKETYLEPFLWGEKSLPVYVDSVRTLASKDPVQKRRLDTLEAGIDRRMSIIRQHIADKRRGVPLSIAQLDLSKQAMDNCRQIIARFIQYEESQLAVRLTVVDASAKRTSLFLLLSALASILVTTFFYIRIRKDFNEREQLSKSLKDKDEEISRRLHAIQKIANRISQGDYSVRADDQEKDDLGILSVSLNAMTDSLQSSFNLLKQNEWRQTGMAVLNEYLVGNKTEHEISVNSLRHLVTYSGGINGAIYLFDNGRVALFNGYGTEKWMRPSFDPGEGAVGQVFVDRKERIFNQLDNQRFIASVGNGSVVVKSLLLVPILLGKDNCIGVIELSKSTDFEMDEVSFYQESANNIGIALMAAKSRARVQQLLEETQSQSEELQAQHAELENLNTELEAQTQKLQASEEELKVQQEELMQSNQELEERSKVLEERNQLIADKNVEIQQKAEELALSTKYKSEFLANMSHELRTPLNSILLLSRLLSENLEHNLSEDQVESAKVIQSSGSSLLTLIDEILDLSKVEAGKMELEYQQVSLSAVVKDLQNLFVPITREKDLSFKIELEPQLDDTIETDRLRLDQVLRNLLSNAIKFTTKGSVTLRVRTDEQDKENLIFSVTDTGIGIAVDKQKIIFEAFQQADGSTRRKFGGTGLGLSISREIARLLGGEIQLKSVENEGSTFSLIVPKVKDKKIVVKPLTEELVEEITTDVEEVNNLVAENDYHPLHTEIPDEIPDDRNNLKDGDRVILIVEDDVNFAKALLKYTRQQHYKGVVMVRGDLAVSAAEQYKPLAILLDIQLPVMDGWQVMDKIKTNPVTRHIPVHIMSSLQVKKESLLKGAIDFINKPVALEQMSLVFNKIEEALSRSPKKVLIVEENAKHASALSYFLGSFNIALEVQSNVEDSIKALRSDAVDCVILDMGVPDEMGYQTLEAIKTHEGLEHLPIIIFTGKNLSKSEELKIKKYADSIVIKTAYSYQRILDEVGLFLHLVEEKGSDKIVKKVNTFGGLTDVLSGKKVLIADDDVRNIFSLSKALEKYQVKVVSAMDGKEALEQLKLNPDIDVVLMDMMMPEMDGYETIRQIRLQPRYARLPIMAVTAKSMTGDREKCILAGASDYISKPVDVDQLLSLLRVWLYES